MPDLIFAHERLAAIYDPLDPDRSDLDAYAAMVDEFEARTVLDVGCGTGTFACLLAERGIDVIAVDPAAASVAVAQKKPKADQIRWLVADATTLPPVQVDMATMTANVAQVFLSDESWNATLLGIHAALRPGGVLVFETRDPARRAWEEWITDRAYAQIQIPGEGVVEQWCDVLSVDLPFVSFRWTYAFSSDGSKLTSDSTLRFWERSEIKASLHRVGFALDEVREAPDRPGRELVFLARRGL